MESEGQGSRAPAPVLVDITAYDVEVCVDFAMRCSRLRQYAGSGGWQGGLVSAMRLFGGIDVDGTHAGIVIGKVVEVAMCRLAGVNVDLALRDRGDGGTDLVLPCGVVQVKASRKAFQSRFVRDPIESVDWFVFGNWSGLSKSVSIDGYISHAAVNRIPLSWSPRGSWMNREVPTWKLYPIRSLLKIRPIQESL